MQQLKRQEDGTMGYGNGSWTGEEANSNGRWNNGKWNMGMGVGLEKRLIRMGTTIPNKSGRGYIGT